MPEFCDECGSIMRIEKNDKDKVIYVCPVCGWRKEIRLSTNNPKPMEASVSIGTSKSITEVIDESKIKPRGTLVSKICPKCGHGKAYVIVMQTRAADEPPTRIYKCEKCGHTWREYS